MTRPHQRCFYMCDWPECSKRVFNNKSGQSQHYYKAHGDVWYQSLQQESSAGRIALQGNLDNNMPVIASSYSAPDGCNIPNEDEDVTDDVNEEASHLGECHWECPLAAVSIGSVFDIDDQLTQKNPFHPFRGAADLEFAEIHRRTPKLSKTRTNDLLRLLHRLGSDFSFTNAAQLTKKIRDMKEFTLMVS